MARTANPYRVDAGPYSGVGEGLSNLANVFLNSQPDPAKQAQAEAYAWRGRESRENVLDARDARQGRFQLGDVLRSFDPNADNRELYAQGVGTGAMDVDDLGQLMLGMNANFGGSDDQVARSLLGTGTALGEDDFVSRDDREMGRQRNSDNRIREDRAVMTLNQRLGDAFASGQMGLEDIYGAQHPDRYASAAETRAEMAGGGGGDGAGEVDWLAATRRATVEEQMNEAIDNLAVDLGLEPGQVPPDLRTGILRQGMSGITAGDFDSPRRAAGELWQQAVRGTREEGGLLGLGGDTVLDYEAPPAAQPRPMPAQDGTGGDPTLSEAAQAIAQGADPAAVRDRLYQMGYTDDQLAREGL